MRLFHRLFLTICTASVIPLLVVSVVMVRFTRDSRRNALALHGAVAATAAQGIEQRLAALNRSLVFVYELERNTDRVVRTKIVQQALLTNPDFVELALYDRRNRTLARAASSRLAPPGRGPAPADAELLEAVRSGRKVRFGAVSLQGGLPLLALGYPLRGGEALLVRVSVERWWNSFAATNVGETGGIVLVASDGAPLPGFSGISGPGAAATIGSALVRGRASGAVDVPLPSEAGVGAYSRVEGMDWTAVSFQARREAYAGASKMAAAAALTVLLLVGVSVTMAYYAAKNLSEPIEVLTAAAERVSNKELSVPVPPLGFSSEIARLGTMFNEMMEELDEYHKLQIDRILEVKTRIETIVTTIPEGIALADSRGTPQYLNKLASKILAITQANEKGEPSKSLRRLIEVSRTNELIAYEEFGRKRFFQPVAAACVKKDGREIGTLLLLRDVTLLKELDRLKDDLFHSVAHDLRAPITSIQGYAQMAKMKSRDDPKLLKYIDRVLSGCRGITDMVGDILDAAKMETGRMRLAVASVDLAAVAKQVRDTFLPLASAKGVRLEVFDASGVPAASSTLEADGRLIGRLMANIVGNSIKFTPKDGRVSILFDDYGEKEAGFTVSDTGMGIPEDKRKLIFEKFGQVEGPRARAGYGLGLAICSMIVECHGGRIWVESKEGEGSRFRVRLPRKPARLIKEDSAPRA